MAENNSEKNVTKKNEQKDVHTHHCCKQCGCKYGEGTAEEGPFDDEPFNVILTADCRGFEQRVMIVLPNLDAIIHTLPTDYIEVTGWQAGDDNQFGKHQVQILSLRNFFVIDSPKILTETKL